MLFKYSAMSGSFGQTYQHDEDTSGAVGPPPNIYDHLPSTAEDGEPTSKRDAHLNAIR